MSRDVITLVKDNYAQVAGSRLSSNDAGVRAVAEAFGYSAEELNSIPADANMGLSMIVAFRMGAGIGSGIRLGMIGIPVALAGIILLAISLLRRGNTRQNSETNST